MANVWKVAPGENAYMWDACLDSGCTTINWLTDRNFNDFGTKAEIKHALSKKKDGHGGAPYIWKFVHEMRVGDVVVANNGLSRVEGVGRVTSDYLHPDHPKNPRKREPNHRHVRLVNWLVKKPIEFHQRLFSQPAVQLLTEEQGDVIRRAYRKQYPEYASAIHGLFQPSDGSQYEVAVDIDEIKNDLTLKSTTKKALIDARLGQGGFRIAVLKRWGQRCAVTSSVTTRAIRASHIKPWKDATNEERLDPENGLPLIASLDALFDEGLISFKSSGLMIVAPDLSTEEKGIFGIGGKSLTRRPTAKMAAYLAVHRRKHHFDE
jgi:hypothetical protein